MKTSHRRIDEVIQYLLAEEASGSNENLTRELAEVLDYQHEHDLAGEVYSPAVHLDTHSLLPEGRMADPIVTLLQPVR